MLLALLLRTWDLTGVPTGFHGDEATYGIEAQRVLDDGSIGVYTGSALGQPTAPFYLGAITLWLFGPSIWALRILAALAGTLTVAAVYLIVQRRFGHRVAAASSLALATMTWSLHFSRIAFGLSWWPLIVLVAVAAIDRATRSGDRRSWFAAGALSGFGVYVYNSHWLFGLAVVAFMAVWLLWRHREPVNRELRTLIWGPLGALVVMAPLISFARDDANGYFNHFDTVSRTTGPEWTNAGFVDQVGMLIGWYFSAWNSLVLEPTADGGDASGVIRQVPLIFAALAVVGVVEVVRRHRTAFTGLMLATVAVLPLGPALTIDGITRREFAMSPFIAILAGIGAVAILDLVAQRLNVTASHAVATGLVAVVFVTSVAPYFTTFRTSAAQRWVFAEELTESIDIIQAVEQDDPVFVNWFSARHSFGYETLEFLLDGTPGIDRAPLDAGFVQEPSLDLYPDTTTDQLYVLIGDYSLQLDRLRQMYPDGNVVADQQDPRLAAFLVPSN